MQLFSLLIFLSLICTQCKSQTYSYLVLVGQYSRVLQFSKAPTLQTIFSTIPSKFQELLISNPIAQIWNDQYNDYVQIDDLNQILFNQSKILIRDIDDDIEEKQAQRDETIERDLRNHLLENYDKAIWPWKMEEAAANVEMNINFHRVLEVDLTQGSMTLLVWVRLRWIDPRLTWDPLEWNNIKTVWFEDNEFESGELWTPRIELWNSHEPMAKHLYPQQFVVSDNGAVFWSRNGRVMVACNIEGLDNFPYDYTECVLEFGSWVYDRAQVMLSKLNEGYETGGSLTSIQSEHQQYEILTIQLKNYSYPAFDGYLEVDGWPVLLYRVVIRRQFMLYTFKIALPQGVLTMVGFGAFWMSPACGERMALAITIPVANAVYDLLVYEQLPESNQMVFASLFGLGNFIFAMFVVLETVVVIMLWEKQDPYLGTMWRSLRKISIDYMDQRDWVVFITASDEYLGKLVLHSQVNQQQKLQRRGRIAKPSRFLQWKQSLGSALRRSFSSSIRRSESIPKQDIPTVYETEEANGHVENIQSNVNNQEYEQYRPILTIADIQTKEDVNQFFKDLVRYQVALRGNHKFEIALNRLVRRYGEIAVKQRVVSLLAKRDEDDDFMGVHLKDYRKGAAEEYNQKWRMLSMMIDRACQVIVVSIYLIYVSSLITVIARSEKESNDTEWFDRIITSE